MKISIRVPSLAEVRSISGVHNNPVESAADNNTAVQSATEDEEASLAFNFAAMWVQQKNCTKVRLR